jgi:hypothetical protein
MVDLPASGSTIASLKEAQVRAYLPYLCASFFAPGIALYSGENGRLEHGSPFSGRPDQKRKNPMSIIDSTMINLAAGGAMTPAGSTPPGTPPAEGSPSSADGKPKGAADAGGAAAQPKPGGSDRPATTDFITSILDRHGLNSPEELSDFIDNLANVRNVIGDEDPEELVKAKETLTRFNKEWEKEKRAKLREKESPEDTIARLEKELQDEQTRKSKTEARQRKVAEATRALKDYASTVSAAAATDTSIPKEYLPFLNDFMGVESPVNNVDILDRVAVKKLTKEYGIKRMNEFAQTVIKLYRDGKAEIPQVPAASNAQPPVSTENQPKTLKESRRLLHAMLPPLLRGGQ